MPQRPRCAVRGVPMPAKKILFFVDTLELGGLSHVVLVLLEAMRARGLAVGLGILEGLVEQPLPKGAWIRVHDATRSNHPRGHARFRRRSTEFARRTIAEFEASFGGADLVIAAGELALRCLPATRTGRLIASSHSSQLQAPKHPGWLGRARLALKRLRRGARLRRLLNGRHVHVVSQGLATELVDELHVRPASVHVIHNPFDIAGIRDLASGSTPQSAAQHLPFVVGVGHFVRRKRFDRLIDAFVDSGIDGELLLIGQGPEETMLRARAAERGIAERFRIIPFHPNHHALVRKARLVVLTSDSEGFANVLVEALIVGVPALATDCPHGPRDILGPIDARALVPLSGLELLPVRIRELANDPYPIPETIVQHFALDRVVDQYLALAELFPRSPQGESPGVVQRGESGKLR
jgi:glycosyltransferase involved in cell wall biosynthesis